MSHSIKANKDGSHGKGCEAATHGSTRAKTFVIAFVALVVLIVSGTYGWRLYSQVETDENQRRRIIELNGTIVHLDEVLTMSARMAAATGDLKWEQRYRSFEPQLDSAIKEAMALAPQDFMGKAVAQTDAANIKLVAMENEAFHLVRSGNHEAAATLLYSQQYKEQKRIYSRGIKQYAAALERYIETKFKRRRNMILGVGIFIGLVVLTAIYSGIGTVKLRKYVAKQKQAEDVLRSTYEELEKANRELKGTQSQLVQNEKLASIGQLAAGIAHEINTPVGFVASNFQTLESYIDKIEELLKMYDKLIVEIEASGKTKLLNQTHAIAKSRDDMKIDFVLGDIQELFADSKEGIGRVTNIVRNLRDFSRIDQPGSLDEYNLNDGIKATLIIAKNEVKYDANVKTDFSEVPSISCHAGQINQVLLNILINAAQAIKSRHGDDMGAITIKTYATDDRVVCEIADNGCGIAPENLLKVFDPFFTTKPTGKGTGLGLSVSYDIIVHKHNGEIIVDSTVGEGSKFTIKLPIGRENPSDDKEEITSNGKKNSIICG